MPNRRPSGPLGAFIKALKDEELPCILIGAMAAIEQGAPLMTIDYDLWVNLSERQYRRKANRYTSPRPADPANATDPGRP